MNSGDDFIYLDYAASTPVDPRVSETMTLSQQVKGGGFANPSSIHMAGRRSAENIATAAGQLAALLQTTPDRLVWTSGATESNNLAIIGAAQQRAHRGKHLITMLTEHNAVADVFRALQSQGFEVTWLKPDSSGSLALADLSSALREDTQLVSVMYVNSETGAVQDIAQIGATCRERDVLLHVDAAQAVGKIPIDLSVLPVDLLSMTAHKLYGPKGIGALYIANRPGVHVEPLLYGGGQQQRIRPGTLPAPLIAGFGRAAEIASASMQDDIAHLTMLRDRLWNGIKDVPGIQVNGDLETGFPGVLNVSVADVEGESLLLALEPLCVATGAACNSKNQEPSYVLRALGRTDDEAQSAIRFSFGRPSTVEEVDFAIQRYLEAVAKLRALAPQTSVRDRA
jgi:cysteine desulfurase